ncbi:hypothetical protein GCM10008992_31450 [Halorubrum aquaticum]
MIQEAEGLSQRLGEVWADGIQAYREMDRTHRTVIHKERYVSSDGVHINQAECLFSIVQPWLQKFHSLSKQGLEQAAHTFGIVQSLLSPEDLSRQRLTVSLSGLSAILHKSVNLHSYVELRKTVDRR